VRKAAEVDEAERSENRSQSRIRARVEHVFAVVKRLWGFAKVRYRGLDKNATRAFVALGLANIDMARAPLMASVRPQRAREAPETPMSSSSPPMSASSAADLPLDETPAGRQLKI
jgi:hypothetical protein